MKYVQIYKGFFVEEAGLRFTTLKEAKKVKAYGHIYRIWIGVKPDNTFEEIGRQLVRAFGQMVCLIVDADDAIRTKLMNEEIKHKRINCHG